MIQSEAIAERAIQQMARIPEPPYEPGYRLHHGQRVAKLAQQIATSENLPVHSERLAAGALLHDIGKFQCPKDASHAVQGAEIVRTHYCDLASSEDLEAIAQIVLHHYDRPLSMWFENKEKPSWCPEILVVQDADVLDHFGLSGIWLSLHWACHHAFSPLQAAENWFHSEHLCSWRTEARRSLNYATSRRMLELRIAEMDDFFRRLQATHETP